MEQLTQCLVLLLVACLRVSSCVSDVESSQCPVWKWLNHTSGECQCGYTVLGGIKCSEDNGSVYARFDVCVSWDTHSESVLASICKYKRAHNPLISRVFSEISKSPYNLSFDECELNRREGVFCGDCKEGFAPSLYIFSGTCVSCTHCIFNNFSAFFMFLLSEIIPLTIFYLIVMCLHLNIVSSPALGYVVFCQAHINFVHTHSNIWKFILSSSGKHLMAFNVYVLLPLSGIWNLNFFSMFLPNLCYSCGFNNILGILMNYIPILYIFILITVTYYFSRNNMGTKIATSKFCKPAIHFLIRWRRNWSFSDSVLHALATFTALFISKVGVISMQLINIERVININGTLIRHVLSFEPSMESFSQKHIPYATVAFISIIIFVILPLSVPCLYPNRHIQWLLSCLCGPRQRISLAMFVDTMFGGYRDGLDGGWNWMRLFPMSISSFALAIAIIVYSDCTYSETYFIFAFPFLLFVSFCVLYFKPCKRTDMNLSLAFHILILALFSLSLSLWMQDYFLDTKMLEIFMTVCLTLPHVVMLVFLLTNILRRCHSLRNCYLKIKILSFGRAQLLMQ